MTNDQSLPTNARELAFAVLCEHDESREFATRLLDRRIGDLPTLERGLATELVHGIVRRGLTLDTLLQRHVSRPRQRVENALWRLLQMGAYQLVFLDGIPDHAAVSETVNLAKRRGQPRWSGFLNGVLRSLSRDLTREEASLPAAANVPLTAGRFRRLTASAFPDPEVDPAGYFATAFSFPNWLAQRWAARFERDESFALGFWFNEPHGVTLRVNAMRESPRDAILADLREAGFDAQPGQQPEAICLETGTSVAALPGFAEGRFTVQDESAMAVGRLLMPAPGSTVLDLCAAPGTKATHLAELMQDRGRILATDISEDRLVKIVQNADRLRLSIIEPGIIPPNLRDVPAGPFDAILVDAPCSNTGVLGKRPEARWRVSPEDITELAGLQLRLLNAAADRLVAGGRLVYSTCSIEPEENAGVIAAFLDSRSDYQLQEQIDFHPGAPSDGGFAALLTRAP